MNPRLLRKAGACWSSVIYGITQTIGGALTGACAATGGRVGMTDVSKFLAFIESALVTTCSRKRVDELDVAQCW